MRSADIDLSIIIVNWNTRDLLAQCLQSVYAAVRGIEFEVVVVDNGSTDGSPLIVRRSFPEVRLIENRENVGFVRANNQALALCHGRFVLLLNSDTQVLPGSLEEMVRFMDECSAAGAAGARLFNPDGTFQASHTSFPTLRQEFFMLSGMGRALIRASYPSFGPEVDKGPQKVGYVSGACLLVRYQAIEEVGMLDESIFMYSEEVDWCYRFAQEGWGVWYLPQATIVHYGGQSTRQRQGRMEAELYRSRVYFFRKHYGRIPAWCLKVLIYTLTPPKALLHVCLRFLTNGRRGRVVTSWKDLRLAFRS